MAVIASGWTRGYFSLEIFCEYRQSFLSHVHDPDYGSMVFGVVSLGRDYA